MHRYARGFADGHEARHHAVGVTVLQRHHFAVHVARDSAHVVVHGGQHGDRILVHVDAGEDARGLGDAGQACVNHFGAEMFEVQVDVILVRTDAATGTDFDGH